MARSRQDRSRTNSVSTRAQSNDPPRDKRPWRQATLYDAVAGRISSNGFIPPEPRYSKYRDTVSSSSLPIPPEEVLFRSQGAPERYEEDDLYWADRNLGPDQTLPESDLLKAVHSYASYFYGRSTQEKGTVDFESFDETALICMGILLEETAEHVLGETGDLAFIEGEDIEDIEEADKAEEDPAAHRSPTSQETTQHGVSSTPVSADSSKHAADSEGSRKRKRRKIRHDEDHPRSEQERRRAKRKKREDGPPAIKTLDR